MNVKWQGKILKFKNVVPGSESYIFGRDWLERSTINLSDIFNQIKRTDSEQEFQYFSKQAWVYVTEKLDMKQNCTPHLIKARLVP